MFIARAPDKIGSKKKKAFNNLVSVETALAFLTTYHCLQNQGNRISPTWQKDVLKPRDRRPYIFPKLVLKFI